MDQLYALHRSACAGGLPIKLMSLLPATLVRLCLAPTRAAALSMCAPKLFWEGHVCRGVAASIKWACLSSRQCTSLMHPQPYPAATTSICRSSSKFRRYLCAWCADGTLLSGLRESMR